jgi:hypothetical protein
VYTVTTTAAIASTSTAIVVTRMSRRCVTRERWSRASIVPMNVVAARASRPA